MVSPATRSDSDIEELTAKMRSGGMLPVVQCDESEPIEVRSAPPQPSRDRQGRAPGGNNLESPPGKPKPDRAARSTADRFQTLNAFIDFTMGSLTRADLATWLILYRDSKQGTARTSQTDIARRGGLSDRAVKRSIKSLVRSGLLRVVHQGGFRKGVSRYRVVPLADHAQGEAYFPS